MILGICGSPRKKATEFVLNKALEMASEAGFETKCYKKKNSKRSLWTMDCHQKGSVQN
jgi:multimeric flavodoxin WrbA